MIFEGIARAYPRACPSNISLFFRKEARAWLVYKDRYLLTEILAYISRYCDNFTTVIFILINLKVTCIYAMQFLHFFILVTELPNET